MSDANEPTMGDVLKAIADLRADHGAKLEALREDMELHGRATRNALAGLPDLPAAVAEAVVEAVRPLLDTKADRSEVEALREDVDEPKAAAG